MALVFFMIYIFFSKKCKSFTAKSLVAVAHSAIYIVILFFENCFYKYIYVISNYKFASDSNYSEFIISGFKYFLENGNPNYILIFVLLTLFLMLVAVWQLPKFAESRKDKFEKFINKQLDYNYFDDEEESFNSIEEALKSYIEGKSILDARYYICNLELNEENKLELIKYCKEYKLDFLYNTLLRDYIKLLTKEEYSELRDGFIKTIDLQIKAYEQNMKGLITEADEFFDYKI